MGIDYKDFSHELDGLWPEILAQYGIEIPKMRGINSDNHPCPLCGGHDRAHWRDVNGRLCLFCRSCAADTMHPPESVIMAYSGIDFGELVQDLAGFINHVPIEQVRVAQKRRQIPSINLPKDHKEDAGKSFEFLAKCSKREVLGADIHELDGDQYLAIHNHAGLLVNVAGIGRDTTFLAGGISYGAFSRITKNDDKKFLVVASPWHGRIIAEDTGLNVLIAFTAANIKFVIWSAPSDLKLKPVLCDVDSQADKLCDDMGWLHFDYSSRQLTKKKQGESLD